MKNHSLITYDEARIQLINKEKRKVELVVIGFVEITKENLIKKLHIKSIHGNVNKKHILELFDTASILNVYIEADNSTIQIGDIIRTWYLDFFEGNVINYLLKDKKNKTENLKKVCHYIDTITVEKIIDEYTNLTTIEEAALKCFYSAINTNNRILYKQSLELCLFQIQKTIKELK